MEAFEKAVARIGRLVPGALSKSARRAKFLTRFLMGRELERMWSEGVGKVGGILRSDRLEAFREEHKGRWVFLPLDKNSGKLMVVCSKLFYAQTCAKLTDTKQFALVSEHRDHKAATEACMSMLSTSAETFGLDIKWEGGRRKGPPTMFELPKNKMEEEVGGAWKGRTVFSHFRHPLKGFARRVGRALTLLIRLSQSCMDTLEMG